MAVGGMMPMSILHEFVDRLKTTIEEPQEQLNKEQYFAEVEWVL